LKQVTELIQGEYSFRSDVPEEIRDIISHRKKNGLDVDRLDSLLRECEIFGIPMPCNRQQAGVIIKNNCYSTYLLSTKLDAAFMNIHKMLREQIYSMYPRTHHIFTVQEVMACELQTMSDVKTFCTMSDQ
jgi:hypothetical protein